MAIHQNLEELRFGSTNEDLMNLLKIRLLYHVLEAKRGQFVTLELV